MFDLPTGSKSERRSYADFRKFLVKDGYHMEQFSIYSRVLLSRDSAETHLKRLRGNLPSAGAIMVLTLTEKQYESREVLVDCRTNECRIADPGPQLIFVEKKQRLMILKWARDNLEGCDNPKVIPGSKGLQGTRVRDNLPEGRRHGYLYPNCQG